MEKINLKFKPVVELTATVEIIKLCFYTYNR